MKRLMRWYKELHVSGHALEEFRKGSDEFYTPEAFKEVILAAKQVSVKDCRLQGFSSNYKGRASRGVKSWYLIHPSWGWKLVFVVTESTDKPEDLVVVTVLHNRHPLWAEDSLCAGRAH